MSGKVKVAVVTGSHPFDLINFQKMFKTLPGITCYFQHMEDFVTDTGKGMDFYDVILFYHMITDTPEGKGQTFKKQMKQVLTNLGKNEQGIIMLHHSLVAFPEWDFWSDICGISDRVNEEVYEGVEMNFNIDDKTHYITKGLDSWKMVDEIYTIPEADENEENHILITTDHEKSMKTIGWTRNFENARVFCLASGHDNHAFSNDSFKTILKRGIEWSAGVI